MDFILERISSLHRYSRNGKTSPFKHAFLLAIASLYDQNPFRENKFTIDKTLEDLFISNVHKLSHGNIINPLIEYPFFHLQQDGFWHLKFKYGYENIIYTLKNEGKRFTKSRINKYVEYGFLDKKFDIALRDQKNRILVMNTIIKQYSLFDNNISIHKNEANQFVLYLNSMQSIQGNNTSALAEAQSISKHFSLIEERHPLTTSICNELLAGSNIIITGHAGDGKSTIAIEVFKELSGLDLDKPLDKPLAPEEHIAAKGITIIKDLSECADSAALLGRMIDGSDPYLIITNTGALLDMFKSHNRGGSRMESTLLEKLRNAYAELDFEGRHFSIYNLARMDNLPLARSVLIKMLDEKNWAHCRDCPHKTVCPILANRDCLCRANFRAVDRAFLIYRRLLAYGTRLTMRQIMEHLAWSITGGKSICDADKFPTTLDMSSSSALFHHLFFGNDGLKPDSQARHMKAIAALNVQSFGSRLTPELERSLWSEAISFSDLDLPEIFSLKLTNLRRESLHPNAQKAESIRQAAAARTSVRRILYFYGQDIKKDIDTFLDSPFTRKWNEWTMAGRPDDAELQRLRKQIMFVLREHFSGRKSSADVDCLDITLHRDIPGLRQSVQILSAQIHIRAFKDLVWIKDENPSANAHAYKLLLCHADHDNVQLQLDVAFLDYVYHRYCGEISGALSRAYKQRLENFRNMLTGISHTSDSITLLRSLTDTRSDTFQCVVTSSGNLRIF